MVFFLFFRVCCPCEGLSTSNSLLFAVDGKRNKKKNHLINNSAHYNACSKPNSYCRYLIIFYTFRACCCWQGLNDSWPQQPLAEKEQQFTKPHLSHTNFYTWLWHACAPSAPKLPSVLNDFKCQMIIYSKTCHSHELWALYNLWCTFLGKDGEKIINAIFFNFVSSFYHYNIVLLC